MARKKAPLSKFVLMKLDIDSINADQRYQFRVNGVDQEHVRNLMDALKDQPDCLPPVTVISTIDGQINYLVDGFHTLEAHKKMGLKVIQARVKKGTVKDVLFHAANANSQHRGKQRSKADIHKAITAVVKFMDETTKRSRLTCRRIASIVGISKSTAYRELKALYPQRFTVETITKVKTHPKKTPRLPEEKPLDSSECPPKNIDDQELGLSVTVPEVGSVVPYDWVYHEKIVSSLARIPDNIANSYPAERKSIDFSTALAAINNAIAILNNWKRRLTGT